MEIRTAVLGNGKVNYANVYINSEIGNCSNIGESTVESRSYHLKLFKLNVSVAISLFPVNNPILKCYCDENSSSRKFLFC